MARELFPLGTVVKLKDTEKLMMICGYASATAARPGYIYDYSGFVYPEGYVDMYKVYQFNNEQIEGIVAMGYQDRETIVYMHALEEKLQELRAAGNSRTEEDE
ncbi:MAG: DUF4176 domain-containing protein [Lachnospiraceae bacterium]